MSEVETFHDSRADRDSERVEEVVFREDTPRMESPTPPSIVTANDLDIIIEGWDRKFEHLSQCMQEIQLASEKANSNMNNIVRDGRAREGIQERRIEEMHMGLTQFLERCDPAHLTAPRRFDAPAASTPFTPTGVPSRLRPDFVTTLEIRATETTTTLEIRATETTTMLEIVAETTDPTNNRCTRTTEGIAATRSANPTTVV